MLSTLCHMYHFWLETCTFKLIYHIFLSRQHGVQVALFWVPWVPKLKKVLDAFLLPNDTSCIPLYILYAFTNKLWIKNHLSSSQSQSSFLYVRSTSMVSHYLWARNWKIVIHGIWNPRASSSQEAPPTESHVDKGSSNPVISVQ